MNKKILITLGSLLVASSLMAGSCNMQKNSGSKSCDTKQNCNSNSCGSKGGFIPMVMGLDLSDEQRTKIKTIMANAFTNTPNPHDAFSETAFDKKKFMELAKQKRDAKLERKAQMMQEVHAVLTKEQKVALKKQLDAKPMMCDATPKKKNNSQKTREKNCN